MELFKGTNLIDFIDRFENEEKCKKYLVEIRWANSFTCSKCSHKDIRFNILINRMMHQTVEGILNHIIKSK